MSENEQPLFPIGFAQADDGISQRRLLAGMILQGIVCGMFANNNNVGWTVEGNVKAAIQCADELIKQTEET